MQDRQALPVPLCITSCESEDDGKTACRGDRCGNAGGDLEAVGFLVCVGSNVAFAVCLVCWVVRKKLKFYTQFRPVSHGKMGCFGHR